MAYTVREGATALLAIRREGAAAEELEAAYVAERAHPTPATAKRVAKALVALAEAEEAAETALASIRAD